jgi:hypothetical protein
MGSSGLEFGLPDSPFDDQTKCPPCGGFKAKRRIKEVNSSD